MCDRVANVAWPFMSARRMEKRSRRRTRFLSMGKRNVFERMYLIMKGRRGSLGTACRVTWGIFWAIWEAHGPSEGPSGDEVGTAGVHQWQRVGPKRVQGGPCAPKVIVL